MSYTQERLLRMLADVISSHFPISDVQLLLQAGVDPNGCVAHGLRPLHYAAFSGDNGTAYIDTLVEHGAQVNCADDVGYSPLHVAAKAGHVEALQTLLKHGAEANGLTGRSANQRSARAGRSTNEASRRRTKQDDSEANIGTSESGNEQSQNTVIRNVSQSLAARLELSRSPVRDSALIFRLSSPAMYVSENRLQVQPPGTVRSDSQEDEERQIQTAPPNNSMDAESPGVQRNTDISQQSSNEEEESEDSGLEKPLAAFADSPLCLAVENDHIECAELLLQHGADPNIKSFLGYLINTMPLDNHQCLRLLLRHGAEPDSLSRGGMTALMRAAKQKQVEAVKILLEYGADVNSQCPPRFDRRRAIHFAAMVGSLEIVQLLLEAGGYTSKPDGYCCAPLECAVVHDRVDICNLLLDHGADPNELNDEDCTPLQVVCATAGLKHQREIIEALLRAGSLPNLHSSHFSYTGPSLCPLIEYLTYCEDLDFSVVRLFLQFGAIINFTVPTRLLRIQDACGVLGQLRKLRPHDDVFALILDSARCFDRDAIERDTSLANGQRASLLSAAGSPRSLMQSSRITIIRHLTMTAIRKRRYLPQNCAQLPLPSFLKKYLLFEA